MPPTHAVRALYAMHPQCVHACYSRCAALRCRPAVLPHLCLQVNYRTHSGILGVASAVVDVLKTFWPDSIDNLAREEAFFHVSLPTGRIAC